MFQVLSLSPAGPGKTKCFLPCCGLPWEDEEFEDISHNYYDRLYRWGGNSERVNTSPASTSDKPGIWSSDESVLLSEPQSPLLSNGNTTLPVQQDCEDQGSSAWKVTSQGPTGPVCSVRGQSHSLCHEVGGESPRGRHICLDMGLLAPR